MTTPVSSGKPPQQSPCENRYLTLLLCICAGALPWSIVSMQIGVGLVSAGAIFCILRSRDWRIFGHPFFFFALLYLVLRVISATASPEPVRSLRYLFHNEWVLLLVPFLAFAFASSTQLRRVAHVLLISAALASIYGIIQMFWGIDVFRDRELARFGDYYRSTGGYNLYLTYAGNQMMAFATGFGLILLERKETGRRILYLAAGVLISISIVASFARSTWLALVLLVALGSLAVSRRLFGWTMAGLITFAAASTFVFPEVQERFTSIFDVTANEGRFNLWATSWNMITENPWWGIGPGMFDKVFHLYKVPGFYDAFGHSHNDFLNVAANSGLPALLTWMLMWISWFYFAVTAYWSGRLDGLDKQLTLGGMLAVCGILFAALFQCYYTDLENNILWWFIAAMCIGISHRYRTLTRRP